MSDYDKLSKLGLKPGQTVFHFELVRLLGIGGFAEVWLAKNLQTDKHVALKFIHRDVGEWEKIITYLNQELKKLRRAEHPNVVTVHGVHEDKARNIAAIEMEYLSGGTLLDRLDKESNKCFEVKAITPWIDQLCLALTNIHRYMVHRDLNPNNLMFSENGDLKVMDFGIARRIVETEGTPTWGIPNIAGTRPYRSPEQVAGEDAKVTDDIYAVGVIMYQLLTGVLPISSDNPHFFREEAIAPNERRVQQSGTGLGPIPLCWEQTILSCLAKRPGERPQSATQLWKDLNREPAWALSGSIINRIVGKLSSRNPTDVAVSLKNRRVVICIPDHHVLLSEPCVVIADMNTKEAIAVGSEAQRLLGTRKDLSIVQPVKEDVIADIEATKILLQRCFRKIAPKSVKRLRIAATVPCHAGIMHQRVLREALDCLEAYEIHLIEDPVVVAVGVGLPVQDLQQPHSAIIYCGSFSTQIAGITFSRVTNSRSVFIGGDDFDLSLREYFRRNHRMEADDRDIQHIKSQIPVFPIENESILEIRGRSLNQFTTISVPVREVQKSLLEPIYGIAEQVRLAIGTFPPAVVGDIARYGFVMAGEGIGINGIDKALNEQSGARITLPKNPHDAFMDGVQRIFSALPFTATTN